MKFAVIDLGSNTFHLMIVKISGERFIPSDILYRESYMTSLSSGGGKTILQKNWDDALQTAEKIKSVLNFYHVENIKITGTAVLRTADNRKDFYSKWKLYCKILYMSLMVVWKLIISVKEVYCIQY
ncbi:MAG: hypothetical protein IPL63_15320 [Saprospiraceae bacterium]|nr:hypothetical protein [Saprospiraceae bacterium]